MRVLAGAIARIIAVFVPLAVCVAAGLRSLLSEKGFEPSITKQFEIPIK